MSILVQCPACKRRYQADDNLAGTQMGCVCGHLIWILPPSEQQPTTPNRTGPANWPQSPTRSSLPGAAPTSVSGQRQWQAAKPARSAWVPIAAVLGGAGALCLLIVTVVLSSRGKPAAEDRQAGEQVAQIAAPANDAAVRPPAAGGTQSASSGQSLPVAAPPPPPPPPVTSKVAENEPASPSSPFNSAGQGTTARPQADDQPKSQPGLPIAGAQSALVYAPEPSPLVAVDNVVYNVDTGKATGAFPETLVEDRKVLAALSPEGKHLATAKTDFSRSKSVPVALIACDTGKTVRQFECKTNRLTLLRFLDEERLLCGCRREAGIWKVPEGKQVRSITLPYDLSPEKIAVTQDGNYLALVSPSEVLVYDTASGRTVAKMEEPASSSISLSFCYGVAFTPDAEELAAWVSGHLLVWSKQGKLTLQHQLVHAPNASLRGVFNLEWLPDKSGWLLAGRQILLRDPRLVVWELHPPTLSDWKPHRLLKQDRLAVVTATHENGRIITVSIPWDKIRSAVNSLQSGGKSLLSPGQSISLHLEIGEIRFAGRQEVTQQFTEILTQRLKKDGIGVAQNQPVVLAVKYAESKGRSLRVTEQQGRFLTPMGGRDTGRRVDETTAQLDLVLTANGASQPVWKDSMSAGADLFIEGEVTDANVRAQMFKSITRRLTALEIPYLIPKDPNAVRLPIIVKLGD